MIKGVRTNMSLLIKYIDESLLRRQKGHGRGRRMQIEQDLVEITSGVRHGYTLGSPIALVVNTVDFKHWEDIMGEDPIDEDAKIRIIVSRPRPGHADIKRAMKYYHRDKRNVLERTSPRETTAQVATGTVAKIMLKGLGINVVGYVKEIAGIKAKENEDLSIEERRVNSEESPVRVLDKDVEQPMMDAIDQAKADGDSIGGVCEVYVEGM